MEESFEFDDALEFQIIKNILSNRSFLVAVAENIRPEFFDNLTAKICITVIKDYFAKFSDVPTVEIIKAEAQNILTPKDDKALFQRELDVIIALEPQNEDYLRSKVIEHCQFQAIKRAILQSSNLLVERGQDYKAKISDSFKKALSITDNTEGGLNYFKEPEERLKKEMQEKKYIPTGIKRLSEILGGGWTINDTPLVILVAPTGVGKSIFLCKFGHMAILHSYKVVHITHELSEEKVAARYDSLFSKVAQRNRLTEVDKIHKDKLRVIHELGKWRSVFGEALRIKEFPTKTATPNNIRAYLQRLKDYEGFEPDLIINDYLDLMLANHNMFADNDYRAQKRISEELRALAQEFDRPILTASQTNRVGADKEQIKGIDVSESFGKVMTSDLLLTLNQSSQDVKDTVISQDENIRNKLEGKCHLYIAKNRNGPSGETIKLRINYQMMDVYEDFEEGKDTYEQGNKIFGNSNQTKDTNQTTQPNSIQSQGGTSNQVVSPNTPEQGTV